MWTIPYTIEVWTIPYTIEVWTIPYTTSSEGRLQGSKETNITWSPCIVLGYWTDRN